MDRFFQKNCPKLDGFPQFSALESLRRNLARRGHWNSLELFNSEGHFDDARAI
jgi:hypothetical protein